MRRILELSLLAPLALLRNEGFEIKRRRWTARLALVERGAQCRQPCFLFFKQSQTSAYDIACRAIAALLHLLIDEVDEVLAKAEGRVLGHARFLKYTNIWYQAD